MDALAGKSRFFQLRLFVYALFFVSGAAGLVYEVIWMRMFSVVLGATAPAVAAVLASFMGGLALGSYAGGRLVDRFRKPLLWYAGCEGFIGVFAFAFPAAVAGVSALYAHVYGVLGRSELHVARFLLTCIVILMPTVAMGATLPAVVAALKSAGPARARAFAAAYGLNTLGAVVGILAAGYWLLWVAGARMSLYVIGAVNVVVAVVALYLHLRLPPYVPLDDGDRPEGLRVLRAWAIIGLAFAAGAFGLAAQVLWVRAMSMVVGSAVYAFAALLAVILAAIGLASLLHRALPVRLGRDDRFLVVLLGAASFGFTLSIVALRFSPYIFLWAFGRLGAGFGAAQAITVLTAVLVMFLPSAAVGMVLPALVARWSGGTLGARVGTVYAANTVGAIAGSVGGTFVLLPLLGPVNGLKIVGALAAAVGAMAVTGRRRVILWVFVAVPLVAAAVLAPGPSEKQLNLGVGISPGYYVKENGSLDMNGAHAEELLYYKDGVDGTVAVVRYGPVLTMKVNGKSVASTNYDDLRVERALGSLPVEAHGAPMAVLVVGLGSGITLGAALDNRTVERAVCVEINNAVVEAAGYFAEYNGSSLDDSRLELVREDGRTYVACTDERFDVITSDPIHPWTRGSSMLFSAEHFKNCSGRLNRGGVMAQWLPLYQLSVKDYFMVVNTFSAAFRHVALVYTGRDTVLLGGDRPFGPAITGSPYYIAGGSELRSAAEWAGINTDDWLELEYSAPRALYRPEESEILTELIRLHGGGPGTDRNVVAGIMVAKYNYREGDLDRAGEVARGLWAYAAEHGWPNDDVARLNADIAFDRGIELAEMGDGAGAVKAFKEVLTYTPDCTAARVNIEMLEKTE